jgi:hypothetical protein
MRWVKGAESGTTLVIAASVPRPTTSATSKEAPAATPWCIDERGISDGEKESMNDADLSGPAGSLVIGFNQLAAETATCAIVAFETCTGGILHAGILEYLHGQSNGPVMLGEPVGVRTETTPSTVTAHPDDLRSVRLHRGNGGPVCRTQEMDQP